MGIYEDDIFGTGERKKPDDSFMLTPESEHVYGREDFSAEKKKPVNSSGMRIIYSAPEDGGAKRKFTGFREEKEEEKIEELPSDTVKGESEDEIKDKINDKIRDAYNLAYRNIRRSPQDRADERSRDIFSETESGKQQPKRQLTFEEEKRRRYFESLKKAENDRARAERMREAVRKNKAVLIIDSDEGEIVTENVSRTGKRQTPKAPPKKTAGDKIRMVIIVIAVIAMAVSLGVLIKQYVQEKQAADWEEDVTGLIIDVPEETKKPKKKKKNNDTSETETTTRVLTIEEQWEQLYKDYPNVEFPSGLSLKYAKLYAVNQDFVGYFSIDEFGVGLPVVQSKKDKKDENYYLRKSFYKKYSVYGCPFVPKNNDMVNLDRNTVIYGHNNNANILFAPVNKYKTLDGYKAAPVINFDTIYANYKWKIIAAFIINTSADDDNGYVFNYTFTKMESDEEFMKYIDFVKQRSLYNTGVDILPSDKILTLSTCTHDFDDARFVVVARLVRPGETADVNTDIAYRNEKPRYPQAYYDKKKKKNPYKNAEQWFYSGS